MPISESTAGPRPIRRQRFSAVLRLSGIVAGYGGGNVLRGVSLNVQRGSITCIVGPNGAGKSTVLRAISGLLRPSKGTIEFEGQMISGMSCNSILSRGIAQVPQHDALFPSMTIKENVMMGGYLIRRDRALLKNRFQAVKDLIPIVAERAEEKAGNLSGGERRIVEIARTLMLEPALIMMDEPSLGLDPNAVHRVSRLISAANDAGRTILLIEQNVRLGFKIATHGVIMESGRVHLEGEPGALLADPRMASLYLGGTIEPVASAQHADGAPDAGSTDP
jgi:ABC-type branched-subunit amino acid transport system ATPase component